MSQELKNLARRIAEKEGFRPGVICKIDTDGK